MKTPNPLAVGHLAGETVGRLTRGLQPGEGRTLRDRAGVHMPVRVLRQVERGPFHVFTVGQHHESGVGRSRSLVSDPEVEFLRLPSGEWVPLSYRTPFTFVVTCEADEAVRLPRASDHARLVALAEAWLANVAENLARGLLVESAGGRDVLAAE